MDEYQKMMIDRVRDNRESALTSIRNARITAVFLLLDSIRDNLGLVTEEDMHPGFSEQLKISAGAVRDLLKEIG